MPTPEISTNGAPRVGVYVCHCGSNIASIVDVERVVRRAREFPHVVVAETNTYTCADDTQRHIKEKIAEQRLNRVVVASCTPRTHEPIFRDTLRDADAIFIEEIKAAGLYRDIWQALVCLLPVRSVGVQGDERTYEEVCSLRAVTSEDAMTADWFRFPHDVLQRVANRVCNEVKHINRVLYDVTSKPPGTIEWE